MQHSYIPNTEADRRAMLDRIGAGSVEDLFADIPVGQRISGLKLPPQLTEMELRRELARLAARNTAVDGLGETACFLGGGAYRHYIPSAVASIQSRSEFSTAYTPYQPEISQGTLQHTYEFQSMLCQLTGMDAANTGMYDGATALAEAALMAARLTGRSKIVALAGVRPTDVEVVRAYCAGPELAVVELPLGAPPHVDADAACVLVQSPNFFGQIEDLRAWSDAAHAAGALLVVSVNPVSLGLLKPPGAYGADIVVGEAQSLGNAPAYGGPYVGIFACRDAYLRQLPGRIVGRTNDHEGRTGYVLTLQTREQHIRRERATSNICTSQTLVALGATVYLALVGPKGLREIAELCYHKAHYAAQQIAALPGYALALPGHFFHEFVVQCPIPPGEVNRRLLERDIIGGIDVSDRVPGGLLLCVTELNPRDEIERLIAALSEIGAMGE
ncbi:MAG: aminomethyl-transferring glycine dehydrogenase subunit GcvPA [Chloroflexi bacterium]|nr:aminomethyl-transferring glycine dehydrogenase subunit GcvPA [Chloroflexota bacterium]